MRVILTLLKDWIGVPHACWRRRSFALMVSSCSGLTQSRWWQRLGQIGLE